jgi:His-Xaa-Ser system radical SAM maturase HxsC
MGDTIGLSTVGKPAGTWKGAVIARASRAPVEPSARADTALLLPSVDELPRDVEDYAAFVLAERLPDSQGPLPTPLVAGLDVAHISDGDVLRLLPSGHIRTLYRVGARSNAVFATDRCNSYCLMCSQPPRKVNEQGIVAEHLRLLSLISDRPSELGITGGEPTLLKDGLLTVVSACKQRLPTTALHILSNGRLFYYGAFARRLAELEHPDMMIGVPLYSDVDTEHDHVVQAQGAFEQTMGGLQNLGRHGVPVEVRIVVHRLTSERLVDIAEFIYRNLTFAAHVTFMGLEPMGFAVANLERLWVDPWDYRAELERATWFLSDRGMNVSIYNHQLCTVQPSVRSFCRQSISDWKNGFLPVCDSCALRESCPGFFTSSLQRRASSYIQPVSSVPP